MCKKGLFFIGIILTVMAAQAQVAMGKWRTHFAYNSVSQIAQSENKIFAVSEGSLFSVDKRDGSMEFYSKISGLNGTVAAKIAYDELSKTLLVTYNDGNIDFLSAGGVKNLPDYYNKQMSVDKAVNHILFDGDKAYLACNFGIIMVNMSKMEIRDTYYIGANASDVIVLCTAVHKGNIYAVSETDIYYADVSNPFIINYESWSKMSGLPGSGNFEAMYNFKDELVLLRGGKLYRQDAAGNWYQLDASVNYSSFTVSGNYLIGFVSGTSYVFDSQFAKTAITGLSSLNVGVYDDTASTFWFGSGLEGIVEYAINGSEPAIKYFKPDGPAANTPYYMKFAGERLFVLPGAKWPGHGLRPGAVMIFENNKWKNILSTEIQAVYPDLLIEDFSSVAVDPDDKTHFYVSGASSGIYEFKNDAIIQQYNYKNSNIELVEGMTKDKYQWVDNCVLDKDKNLLITNDNTSAGIKIKKNDDTWIKLDYAGLRGKIHLGKILISNQNQNHKWVVARFGSSGICVFDDNGTLDDQNDDRTVFFSSMVYRTNDEINAVTPVYFNTIAQEKNGTIWVGTTEGPFMFNSIANVFEPDFMANRVIIPRNDGTGLGDYLLENQSISAIIIDGANRKWFGTEGSGVYLMSENCQETIHHFTTKNSPLPSDNILSIDINPITGEVFIGTATGLVSFQSDAAEAGNSFQNVHVYPNPVREDFSGVITITGLVENTTVKITDVAGNLISETKSNGSIATWDGKNKFGQKVSTGIYLAICTSDDGQQSMTQKILVIN